MKGAANFLFNEVMKRDECSLQQEETHSSNRFIFEIQSVGLKILSKKESALFSGWKDKK